MKKLLFSFSILLIASVVYSQSVVWVPYRVGEKWGYADTLGNIKVRPSYDSAGIMEYDFALVYKSNRAGLINNKGVEFIHPAYSFIEPLNEGFKVFNAEKAGYANANGKLIIPVQFDDIYVEDENFFSTRKGEKYGLFAKSGLMLLPAVYDEIMGRFTVPGFSEEKYFLVRKGKEISAFNRQTHSLTKIKADELDREVVEEIMAPPSQETMGVPTPVEEFSSPMGTIMKDVKTVLKAEDVKYFEVQNIYIDQNYFLVTINGKKGIAQYEGKDKATLVVPAGFDDITYAVTNGFGGFIGAASNSKVLAAVSKNGKYGVVNEKGETILPFDYAYVRSLQGHTLGFELTNENKKGVYLANTTYPVIAPKYDSIEYHTAISVNTTWAFSLYKIKIGNKYGYVGENGMEYFR